MAEGADDWDGTELTSMRLKKSMKRVIEEIIKRDTHKTLTGIMEEATREYLQNFVEREYKMSLTEFIEELKKENGMSKKH